MKVEIVQDKETEMLSISVNGTCFFYGNYWDFNVPGELDLGDCWLFSRILWFRCLYW